VSRPVWQLEAEVFRLLGHPTRMRLVESLRGGERTVSELQAVMQLESSGTSQQLNLLRKAGVLSSRKEGTSVYYRVRDPRILQIIDLAREVLTSQLEEQQALLEDLSATAPPTTRRREP
jgi:ArsR family transcriptional regulator